VPDKLAFADRDGGFTFREISDRTDSVGSFLAANGYYKEPVVVFMGKSPRTVTAFFGVIAAGCFYVPLDEEMPRHRIELIFGSLRPRAVICDAAGRKNMEGLDFSGQIYTYEDVARHPVNAAALTEVRARAIDTDPIYVVFTSGSTGLPKGVVACHRSVIDYIENLSAALRVDENTVFGNQAPLYVDACLKELYPTLKFGATAWFIPKEFFMFPVKLVEFLNEHQINTVCWVASALALVAGVNTFATVKPEHLRTVAFGSEVFPIKHLNAWRAACPEARFINLYGPTEATGMSCYYEVDREFELDEKIPIGRPFRNTEILLLDPETRKPVTGPGQPGEICIRGTAVTLGYYNNPEKTAEAFIQNPLNIAYPEPIYCTGDLGAYNERGELVFISRKDYQIKHMGHRIELGEIETAANMLDGVRQACCLFDDKKKKIVMAAAGELTPAEVIAGLKEKLPRYMIPSSVIQVEALPLTPNGKIDRVTLKNQYILEKQP